MRGRLRPKSFPIGRTGERTCAGNPHRRTRCGARVQQEATHLRQAAFGHCCFQRGGKAQRPLVLAPRTISTVSRRSGQHLGHLVHRAHEVTSLTSYWSEQAQDAQDAHGSILALPRLASGPMERPRICARRWSGGGTAGAREQRRTYAAYGAAADLRCLWRDGVHGAQG